MNIFILDDTIEFLMEQADYLEHIEEIERLKMESNTMKAGLGLIDINNEAILQRRCQGYQLVAGRNRLGGL